VLNISDTILFSTIEIDNYNAFDKETEVEKKETEEEY
jgi:hypothetical protein